MMENKANITQRLLLCLMATRAGDDIEDMSYGKINREEIVSIRFKHGSTLHVNVTADSGLALIKDVIKALM